MAVSNPRPDKEGVSRRNEAINRRDAARNIASNYPNPPTKTNTDEVILEADGYAMSFTKGLHHNENGVLIENDHYSTLTEAINQDAPTDFTQVQSGISGDPTRLPKTTFSGDAIDAAGEAPQWRGWESPRAGHYYSLEGPDADAVGMPPAPSLDSVELEAEIAEVYALALLRDVPFSDIATSSMQTTISGISVDDVITEMAKTEWYTDKSEGDLTLQERRRRAARFASHADHDVDVPPNDGEFSRKNAFRGSSPGVQAGPYISQFMVQGTQLQQEPGDGDGVYSNASIRYGSQEIDQKVTFFPEAVDYMLHWNAYLDVQNGADFGDANNRSHLPRRFIHTPRDLATYVRFDQLYQAYLNACLYMLGTKEFDLQKPVIVNDIEGPGFPDRSSSDSRQGFATFGGPHVRSRRDDTSIRADRPPRKDKAAATERSHADPHLLNDQQQLDPAGWDDLKNFLLPMALAEGSPMHPSYGAGHATVAGGCVTMLKAFFHTVESDGTPVAWPAGLAVFDVESKGEKLRDIRSSLPSSDPVTISGELNKLAANISIGRNMAGVHFYTDYYESVRMGERVTTGILMEHLSQKDEPLEMSFESFDGDLIHLKKSGGGTQVDIDITNSQGDMVEFDSWWTRHLPDPASQQAITQARAVAREEVDEGEPA